MAASAPARAHWIPSWSQTAVTASKQPTFSGPSDEADFGGLIWLLQLGKPNSRAPGIDPSPVLPTLLGTSGRERFNLSQRLCQHVHACTIAIAKTHESMIRPRIYGCARFQIEAVAV